MDNENHDPQQLESEISEGRKTLTTFPFKKSASACNCGKYNLQDFPQLYKILPKDYDYRLCDYIPLEQVGQFLVTLRMKLSSKDEALEWKRQFEEKSLTTHVLDKSFPKVGRVSVFKVQYRCQFFDRRKTKTKLQLPEKSKFRDCHSILFINIKKFFKNTVDHHMPRYCTILRLHYAHSHPLDTADVLRKRGLNPAIQRRFLEMYQHGTKPKDALDTHKKDLLQKLGPDKYRQVVCDGYYVPNLAKVYRLYYQFHGKGVSAKTSSKRSSRYNPSADWLAFCGCPDIRQASDDDEDDGDVAHNINKDDDDNHASNCGIQLWKRDKNEMNVVCENENEREGKEMACGRPPSSNIMDKDLRHASDLVSAELDPRNCSLSGTYNHHSQLPSCLEASILGSRVETCYAPGTATDCLTLKDFPQSRNADEAPIKVGNTTTVYSNIHAVSSSTSVMTNISQTVVSNQSPKINTEHSIAETQSMPPLYCTSNHGIADRTREEETFPANVRLLSESQPLPWRSFTSTMWSHQSCATSLTASAAADITVVSSQRYQHHHQHHDQHQTVGSANSPSTTEDKQQCYPIQDHHHHHYHHHHPQQQQQHLAQNDMDFQNTVVHSSHLPHNTVYQHRAQHQILQSGAYRFFQHQGMSVISSGHCHPSSCNTSSCAVSSSVNSAVLSLDPNQLHHEHHSKHQHKGHHHPSVSPQGTSHGSALTVRPPWFFSALSNKEQNTEDGQGTRLQNVTASPTLCSSPKDASNANAMTRIVGKANAAQGKSPRYHSCNSCSNPCLTTRRRKTVRMKKTEKKMKEQNIKLLTKRWLERKPRVEAETQYLASELMGDILLREKAEKVKVRLQTFLSGVESRMTLNPKLFVPAVEKFLQVGESATGDAELAALLQGFGGKAEAGLVCQHEEKEAHVLLNANSTQILLTRPALKRAVMNSSATLSRTKRRRRNNAVGIPTDLNCVNSRKKKTLELMSF